MRNKDLASAILAAGFIVSALASASPVHGVAVPNSVEGNWSSWSLTYSITSGQAWMGQANEGLNVDTNGASLVSGNGNVFSISATGTATDLGFVFFGSPLSETYGNQFNSALYSYTVFIDNAHKGQFKIISGGVILQTVTTAFTTIASLDISPDGQYILVADTTNPFKVALYTATGTGPTPITVTTTTTTTTVTTNGGGSPPCPAGIATCTSTQTVTVSSTSTTTGGGDLCIGIGCIPAPYVISIAFILLALVVSGLFIADRNSRHSASRYLGQRSPIKRIKFKMPKWRW